MDVLTDLAPAPPVPAAHDIRLTVIVPVYNEEEVLPEFHRRLGAVLDAMSASADGEIVYVNDGSRDRSAELLGALREADARVAVVDLSRNFGKEIAMSAGLDFAHGDAVIIIDADLQDPPELIPQMFAAWQSGADVVLMRRRSRAGESWMKRATAPQPSPTRVLAPCRDFAN